MFGQNKTLPNIPAPKFRASNQSTFDLLNTGILLQDLHLRMPIKLRAKKG